MKQRLMSIIAMVVILCVAFSNFSFAADAGCKLTLSSGSAKPGETVTLTLKSSDITVDGGIYMITCNVEYDEDAIESVEYAGTTNWKVESEIENKLVLVTKTAEGTNASEDTVTIKLKVKSDAEEGDYSVTLKNVVVVDDSYNKKELEDISGAVKVEKTTSSEEISEDGDDENGDDENGDDENGDDENGEGEEGDDENGDGEEGDGEEGDAEDGDAEEGDAEDVDASKTPSSTSGSSSQAADNVSNKKLPYTGVETGLGIAVIGALVATIIAGIKYIKYKSVK